MRTQDHLIVDTAPELWFSPVLFHSWCFTSTETIRLIRDGSPGRPSRLSHGFWDLLALFVLSPCYSILALWNSASVVHSKECVRPWPQIGQTGHGAEVHRSVGTTSPSGPTLAALRCRRPERVDMHCGHWSTCFKWDHSVSTSTLP